MKRSLIWRVIFCTLLTAFTLYMLCDTFLIRRVYQTAVETEESTSSSYTYTDTAGSESENASVTDQTEISLPSDAELIGSYSSETMEISVYSFRSNDTTCYAADVKVSSPEILKTAFADNSYGKNVTEKTSEIADEVNAILAINGDYYGAQESGYVIRNGVLYRDDADSDRQDLVIYKDGSMEIINESDISAQELLDNGAYQVLSFGPALVTDGEISVTEGEEVGKAMTSNPRTAIGYISDTHYVFFVSDGRTDESEGLTLYQEAEVLQSLGCTLAYNLDGGGSSTMVFQGEVINNPTTSGNSIKERKVSDIVYIG